MIKDLYIIHLISCQVIQTVMPSNSNCEWHTKAFLKIKEIIPQTQEKLTHLMENFPGVKYLEFAG